MSRFLSGFWGSGGKGPEEEEGSAAAASAGSSTGAASWITMKEPPGGRGEPVMAVNQATVDGVLTKLGDEGAVNLVAIFGAARGGKSFLMNQLAGQDDIFKISNDKDPCTQGVDVSRAVVPLKTFASLGGCTAPREVSSAGNDVRVLFADVEGQGDRDAAYDARLASAILPLTKCVIFNWRDSLQVDRMLNLLGVMQRAAHNVDLGDDGEGTAGPKFGHLHVVFRDWNYQGTAEDVKKQLFGLDNRGQGSEVAVKNELRRTIKAAFASVTVWLFPAPVEMTSELSKELKSEDLSEGFVSQLAAFRSTLSVQLSKPTVFGPANPATGKSLGSLVPALVDVLNKGEVIMPQSAYQQMVDMEAQQVKKTYVAKADRLIKTAITACDNGPPIPPEDLEADMAEAIQTILAGFESEAKALGAKAGAVAEGTKDIKDALDRGMQGLRAHNGTVLGRHLKTAVKEARSSFTEEFTQLSRSKMPLPPPELAAMASAASSRARGRLQAVPSAGAGDDTLEEALSALGDFMELAISKAERENDSLVRAQGKKEEDALSAAIETFQQDFSTDLKAVKAGGGPYQLASVEAAGKAALANASAALRRALLPAGGLNGAAAAAGGTGGGGTLSDRVVSLVGRLEERASGKILEERSEFDRTCAAYMLKLGTEELHRLREDIKTDVYPLLPLESNPELESAFQPVVQRMNDRIGSAASGWALPEQARAQHMDSANSNAESMWQSLFERNERLKLQRENADMGANAQKNQEEAKRLRLKLIEERRKAQEAEDNARNAVAAVAQARLNAAVATQRMRQAVEAREREAAAREQEKREEEARRAEERSLLVMLTIAALAAMDPLALKESVTVVVPDHKPILAVVGMFGWLVWKRWVGLDRRGLHPIFRTVGFAVILAGVLALLPFNSTVTMLEVPLLTADECRTLVEATAQAKSAPDFVPAFSVFDPSTEVPLQDLPPDISAMVSTALQKQLMPFVELEYGRKGKVTLDETLLYVEHYEAYHEPPPSAHVRHGQLLLRVELTPPESRYVGGGGVFLDSMGKTITPGMGSGLVLPAKLRHGSSEPGPNSRSVLVGSLTVEGRDPYQRLTGMWHLWGLFARSVRYVADKSLPSSGVDSLPTPDPEPTAATAEAEAEAAGEEGGSSSGDGGVGSDSLEF